MTAGVRLKRAAIFVHRWLGVVLCLVFLLWFPSGIVMMYWDYPSISPADRLERSPALDAAAVRLSPAEAFDKLGPSDPTEQVRLTTFDGRPVYRFRFGRDESVVYADTGDEQIDVPDEMMRRIVSSWTGQPAAAAEVTAMTEVDQWTIQARVRELIPLWKFAWPNGEHVYFSQATGEVVQYTTPSSRAWAYLGAIPHWLYFTPLRKHGPEWSKLVIWSSGIGTIAALLGVAIGIWMYSPRKKYRYAGTPTGIPYRGQKRWHTVFGLIFGLGAATWAFSGMLSMDPFPARTGGAASGRRGVGSGSIPQALGGRTQMPAFAPKHPREALSQLEGLKVKELELASFVGDPIYLATLDTGDTRIVPVNGEPHAEFDRQVIMNVVRKVAQPTTLAELRVVDRYDRYYLDRRGRRPLPVILARLDDADRTRYYIDPRTARIVGTYSARNWTSRWLYHGLHSLDFPWLYAYRPLWDIVVITFMVGGTALCVTSLVLAWRVLGRKLNAAISAATGYPRPPVIDEDLVQNL